MHPRYTKIDALTAEIEVLENMPHVSPFLIESMYILLQDYVSWLEFISLEYLAPWDEYKCFLIHLKAVLKLTRHYEVEWSLDANGKQFWKTFDKMYHFWTTWQSMWESDFVFHLQLPADLQHHVASFLAITKPTPRSVHCLQIEYKDLIRNVCFIEEKRQLMLQYDALLQSLL